MSEEVKKQQYFLQKQEQYVNQIRAEYKKLQDNEKQNKEVILQMKKAFSQSETGIPNNASCSSSKKDIGSRHQKTKSSSAFVPRLDLTKIKREVDMESEDYEGQIVSEDMVIVDEMKI